MQNGVVAACRLFDIAFGGPTGGGEAILFEKYDGGENYIQNNAFVWCHLYNCLSSAVQLAGGGINNNVFKFIDSDKCGIALFCDFDIVGNTFQNMEVTGILVLPATGTSGTAESNVFDKIVIRRYPLIAGTGVPGQLTYYGYNDPNLGTGANFYRGFPPIVDTTVTPESAAPNQYTNTFLSYPDGLEHVFQSQLAYTTNTSS